MESVINLSFHTKVLQGLEVSYTVQVSWEINVQSSMLNTSTTEVIGPLQTRTNEVFRHVQILCSSKQQKKLKKALQNESMNLRGTSTTQMNIKQVTVS